MSATRVSRHEVGFSGFGAQGSTVSSLLEDPIRAGFEHFVLAKVLNVDKLSPSIKRNDV